MKGATGGHSNSSSGQSSVTDGSDRRLPGDKSKHTNQSAESAGLSTSHSGETAASTVGGIGWQHTSTVVRLLKSFRGKIIPSFQPEEVPSFIDHIIDAIRIFHCEPKSLIAAYSKDLEDRLEELIEEVNSEIRIDALSIAEQIRRIAQCKDPLKEKTSLTPEETYSLVSMVANEAFKKTSEYDPERFSVEALMKKGEDFCEGMLCCAFCVDAQTFQDFLKDLVVKILTDRRLKEDDTIIGPRTTLRSKTSTFDSARQHSTGRAISTGNVVGSRASTTCATQDLPGGPIQELKGKLEERRQKSVEASKPTATRPGRRSCDNSPGTGLPEKEQPDDFDTEPNMSSTSATSKQEPRRSVDGPHLRSTDNEYTEEEISEYEEQSIEGTPLSVMNNKKDCSIHRYSVSTLSAQSGHSSMSPPGSTGRRLFSPSPSEKKSEESMVPCSQDKSGVSRHHTKTMAQVLGKENMGNRTANEFHGRQTKRSIKAVKGNLQPYAAPLGMAKKAPKTTIEDGSHEVAKDASLETGTAGLSKVKKEIVDGDNSPHRKLSAKANTGSSMADPINLCSSSDEGAEDAEDVEDASIKSVKTRKRLPNPFDSYLLNYSPVKYTYNEEQPGVDSNEEDEGAVDKKTPFESDASAEDNESLDEESDHEDEDVAETNEMECLSKGSIFNDNVQDLMQEDVSTFGAPSGGRSPLSPVSSGRRLAFSPSCSQKKSGDTNGVARHHVKNMTEVLEKENLRNRIANQVLNGQIHGSRNAKLSFSSSKNDNHSGDESDEKDEDQRAMGGSLTKQTRGNNRVSHGSGSRLLAGDGSESDTDSDEETSSISSDYSFETANSTAGEIDLPHTFTVLRLLNVVRQENTLDQENIAEAKEGIRVKGDDPQTVITNNPCLKDRLDELIDEWNRGIDWEQSFMICQILEALRPRLDFPSDDHDVTSFLIQGIRRKDFGMTLKGLFVENPGGVFSSRAKWHILELFKAKIKEMACTMAEKILNLVEKDLEVDLADCMEEAFATPDEFFQFCYDLAAVTIGVGYGMAYLKTVYVVNIGHFVPSKVKEICKGMSVEELETIILRIFMERYEDPYHDLLRDDEDLHHIPIAKNAYEAAITNGGRPMDMLKDIFPADKWIIDLLLELHTLAPEEVAGSITSILQWRAKNMLNNSVESQLKFMSKKSVLHVAVRRCFRKAQKKNVVEAVLVSLEARRQRERFQMV